MHPPPSPFPYPTHEPADISDTDISNLLAFLDAQAPPLPPLLPPSILASSAMTIPQSSGPSTASPNQLLTDAELMGIVTTSPQPTTTGISPLVTMERSSPGMGMATPSPLSISTAISPHLTMANPSPIMTMVSSSPLQLGLQMPCVDFNLSAPFILSPPSQTPVSPAPTNIAPLTADSAMLATLAALNELNESSACGLNDDTDSHCDGSLSQACPSGCQHNHLCSPSPCMHSTSCMCSPCGDSHPEPANAGLRTLRRTARLRGNQHLHCHPYTPKGCKTARSKKIVIPAISSDGTPMICCNCGETETPSWRRHPISNGMLCNACGLYYRLHRKPRPIAYDESGKLQVIRKNAAVKREPINIGLSENIVSGLVPPFQALRLLPANGSLSLMNDGENKD